MSECANLFCRNVYSNISTQNNIALTLCWKTTKQKKHNTRCLTSQLDGQLHNLTDPRNAFGRPPPSVDSRRLTHQRMWSLPVSFCCFFF